MRKTTLCWICGRRFGSCSWSADFVPVPGWTARKQRLTDMPGVERWSYHVTECPRFVLSLQEAVR